MNKSVLQSEENLVRESLYSFDVFDTLLTRTVAKPEKIYLLMQNVIKDSKEYENYPAYLKDNFSSLRQGAEMYARENKRFLCDEQEVVFDDIYEVLKLNHNLSEEQVANLKNLEIKTELKNLKPIYKNIEIVKKLLSEGKRVVLISDMYHSSEMIRKFLVSADSIFQGIPIYVSSEYKKGKYTSELYKKVREIENADYSKWVHYGDNKVSDNKKAKNLGIKAILVKQEEMTPYEKYGYELLSDDISTNLVIGCTKYVRLISKDKSESYKLGCSCAGPIFYNYGKWLVQKALSMGIETLCFIARDGYILKEIVDIIISKNNINLKTQYIYGSRIAWRIPTEKNIDKFLEYNLWEYRDKLSINFIADRLKISPENLTKYVNVTNFDKVLTNEKLSKLKSAILNDSDIKNKIIAENKNKAEMVLKYMQQTLPKNGSFAFVDLNGSGRTSDFVVDLVKDYYKKPIYTFFFHTELNTIQTDESKKISFYATVKYRHFLVELLCRCLDGQTLGYEERDGKIVPILEKIDNSYMINWGYYSYLQGVKDFVSLFACAEAENGQNQINLNLYKRYIEYLIKHIDKETADIIGSIPYSEVGSEINIKECAPKYNLIKTLKILICGKKDWDYLIFISEARSNVLFKYVYKFIKKFGSIRKFLIDVSINKKRQKAYVRFLGFKISIRHLVCK